MQSSLAKSGIGYFLICFFFLCILLSCRSDQTESAYDGATIPDKIDFTHDVNVILSDRCFACHGPDKNALEANLRLDTEEGLFAALGEEKNRYAVVPGKPGESELYKRITSHDPDYMMPLPESNLVLSEREKAVIKKWIEQGAEWKPHWAYIPPEKSALPEVEYEEWPLHPLDFFVLKKLEDLGMRPSGRAGKEKLIRRVSFDLTGLPPTVEEVDEFLADDSPGAYEKVVDRLLSSKAYGERLASEWLDVARYADSYGYQDDGPNNMWPWRDWVIGAFNGNLPFDQFATWQIAGDLLPEATREQKIATGFNRLHMQNQEGGIIDEEYRLEYVKDRTNTTGSAFLGLTVSCASCHDHKYDAISENEYYSLAAFYNSVNDIGQIPNEGTSGPSVLLPDSSAAEQIDFLKQQIDRLERSLQDLETKQNVDYTQWESQLNLDHFQPGDDGLQTYLTMAETRDSNEVYNMVDRSKVGHISGELNKAEGIEGAALEFSKGNYMNLGRETGNFERTDRFSFSFWINPSDTAATSMVPVISKNGSIFIGFRGYDIMLQDNHLSVRIMHGWPYNALQVLSNDKIPFDQWSHVAVTYDGSSNSEGIRVYVNGEAWQTGILQDGLFKNIIIDPEEDLPYRGQSLMIGERNQFKEIQFKGLKLDELRIYDRQLTAAEVMALSGSGKLGEILARSHEDRNEQQRQLLFTHYLLHDDLGYKRQLDSLSGLRVEQSLLTDTIREVMTMEDRIHPRDTYVLIRGDYTAPGEQVFPGTPEAVMKFPDDLPRNRLGLARWLVSRENPLTARVTINRYWQMLFGLGLVETPQDFGNQGALPSHPALLDWLAVTFMESGWDLKGMLKQIVMSATYQQSSAVTAEQREKDPENKLLARGPRYRLSAEMVRDNALSVSGLLVGTIGGPSVKPYQPEGLWEETTSGRYLAEYVQQHGDSLYRRSLYTFWKRTSPPPSMTLFDHPVRDVSRFKRSSTSTPLQALVTFNDTQFMEASRMLGQRMMQHSEDNVRDQITYGFKASTARAPGDEEMDLLLDLYNRQLAAYRDNPEGAKQLLAVGEYPVNTHLPEAELAASAIVASSMLNLYETITKE
ncbi:MAG: DUF1553 domain-containing protein [Balneolales bacterium]